jgi:glycerol kinase
MGAAERTRGWPSLIVGVDQGTTGTTTVAYDDRLEPVAEAYRELPNRYPRPGWVEQDPEDVVRTVVETVGEVLRKIGGPDRVEAVGLDNQGETVVAWHAETGRALTPTVVWSDGRGAEITASLSEAGYGDRVRELTGLMLDPYFSAAKYSWLLKHNTEVHKAAESGTLRLGTLDAWLAWRLGGERTLTDHSTASRTQLLGLASGVWEPELLDLFGVPEGSLPAIKSSLDDWGKLNHPSWGGPLPWRSSLVDQPAALAGNGCFAPDEIKVTYGTGCFMLANAGTKPPEPPEGLLASVAWSQGGECTYAFDGGVFTAGTAINWLRSIGVVSEAAETADLALTVENAGGVRFLPAFTGLGAPWWDNDARGAFFGITGGTTRAHLVRAVLDSIAFRVRDVLEAVWSGGRARPKALRVDGGLTKNRYLMQRQADLLGLPVELGPSSEATATGAAALAAVAAGLLTEEQVRSHVTVRGRFEPQSSEDERETEYAQWQDWLRQARGIR